MRLVLIAAALGLLIAPAHAEPGPRVMPDLVKQLMWKKACDIPIEDEEVGTCTPKKCPLQRSDGTPFAPLDEAWLSPTNLEWRVSGQGLAPALVEGGVVSAAVLDERYRSELPAASGLPLNLTPAPDSDSGEWAPRPVLQLNPALVAWIGRELLPPATEPMCGVTAAVFFRKAAEPALVRLLDVWVELAKLGVLKGPVSEEDLSREQAEGIATYLGACKKITARKRPNTTPEVRWELCTWLLRRQVHPAGLQALGALFREAFARYDPKMVRRYASIFPKQP